MPCNRCGSDCWAQRSQAAVLPQPESRTPEPILRRPLNSQYSGSHSGDSSSGGRADQTEHAATSKGQELRASNSGEHEGPPQRGLSVKKSTGERDKNKVAQRAFRQRKKEREKAKCAIPLDTSCFACVQMPACSLVRVGLLQTSQTLTAECFVSIVRSKFSGAEGSIFKSWLLSAQ